MTSISCNSLQCFIGSSPGHIVSMTVDHGPDIEQGPTISPIDHDVKGGGILMEIE
jgi:hypothetical protein